MAQLVLGIAGAAIGSAFGAPQIGFMLGSALGASLTTQRQQGPRLSDLKSPAASYGSVIPYIEGSMRVPGVWVWTSDKQEITSTSSEGGKGGPTVETTTYTYIQDVMILLSENMIGGVRRVWANGKLIYSAAADSDASTTAASTDTDHWTEMRVYTGAADQLPDPTYEAAVGVGNAPAYRGRGAVFIEGLNLGSSGQAPALTFEVVRSGTLSTSAVAVTTTAYGTPATYEDGIFSVVLTGSSFSAAWFHSDAAHAGRRYIEWKILGPGARGYHCGAIARDQYDDLLSSYSGNAYGSGTGWYAICNGDVFGMEIGTISNGVSTENTGADFGVGDVIGVLIDHDALQMDITINGNAVWTTALPAGRSGYDPMMSVYGASNTFAVEVRSDPGSWEFAPSGVGGYEVQTLSVVPDTLQGAVLRQCLRAGLTEDECDVSALTGDITGFAVTQLTAPRTVLESLAAAYNFDTLESNGKLTFLPRGRASVVTIPYGELGTHTGSRVEPLPLARANDVEVPAKVTVRFANFLDAYQDGAETVDRLVSTQEGTVETVEIPLALTPTAARRIAEIRANEVAASFVRVEGLQLGKSYAALQPSDAVTVLDEDGTQLRIRVQRITDTGLVRQIDGALDEITAATGTANTDESYTDTTTVRPKSPSVLRLLDIPLLRDQDDTPGHYAAANRTSEESVWPGAKLFRGESDAGYETVATFTDRTFIGATTTALGASGSDTFDEVNTVTVSGVGTLDSYTRDQVLNGTARPILAGDEILFYRTAALVSAGVYTLSGLLRGRRGTEHEAAAGHSSGVRAVLLQESGLRRVSTPTAKLGVTMDFKLVTVGAAADTVDPTAFANTNVGARPFSPVDARFAAVSGTTVVTWKRRTRLETNFTGPSGPVVPLGEAAEAYEVEVLAGSPPELVGTLETSTPSADLSSVTSGLVLSVGLERIYERSGGKFVGIEYSDPSFLVALAADGSFEARSQYLGSTVIEVARGGTTLYCAGYLVGTTGAQISSKLISYSQENVNSPLATHTVATAGDLGGVCWDGSNPWTTGTLAGTLRKHHPSTLAVLETHVVEPPVVSYPSAYLGHVTHDDGVFYTVVTAGPHAGDVFAWTPTGSPSELWRTNVSDGAGYRPLHVLGSTLLVPRYSGWALLDLATGSLVAENTSGEILTTRPLLGDGSFFALASSSSTNVARVRDESGALVRTTSSPHAGELSGATGGRIYQKRSIAGRNVTTLLGDQSSVQPGTIVRIYQVSATYGRGVPLETVVPTL